MEWFPLLQIWGVFFDAIFGGVSCLLYFESKRILKNLKKAIVIDVDRSLEHLLKTFPNQRIEYAAIRGRISSMHPNAIPEVGVSSKSILAGLRNILKYARGFVTRSNDERLISFTHSLTLRSPWNPLPLPYVLHIDNIPWRDGCTARSNAFIDLSDNWTSLKKGTFVTIYGKLQRIGPGEIRIQYSGDDQAPYIFTTFNTDELMQVQQDEISKFRFFVILYALFGALSLLRFTIREIRLQVEHRRRNRLLREILPTLERLSSIKIDSSSSEITHTMCIICKTKRRSVIFDNCPHVSICEECAKRAHGKCPVCLKVSNGFKYPVYVA